MEEENREQFEDFFLERIDEVEFEQAWLSKFSKCLDEAVGLEIRDKILDSNEKNYRGLTRHDVIEWSKSAMERLDQLVDEKTRNDIMTGCACQMPTIRLQKMREKYAETKNFILVHQMLQEQFEGDLKAFLNLDEYQIDEIRKKGWGVAGVIEGNKIIATKMPAKYHEYMKATDSREKKYLFCHCARIKSLIMKQEENISLTYCYCGAGFYKGIWEEILQQPVNVEVLKSVLQGDEVCMIAIHLPTSI